MLTIPHEGPSEHYMVHDDVWAEAGMGPRGFLCIGCLEKRLGRELTPADFPDVPCNSRERAETLRLLSRLLWYPLWRPP